MTLKGKPKPRGASVSKKKAVRTTGRPKAATRAKADAARKPPTKSPPKPPPAKPQPAPAPASSDAGYGAYRDRQAGISRARSVKGREIGDIPDIADPERREACAKSLRLFCETYNPEAFYLGWSDDHLKAIDRIEEAVTRGALFALAMDRGKGKTTLCRMAALWATLNAICRYAFVIGANSTKATDTLDSLKTMIRFCDVLAADFPEVAWPARCLQGIANRATGQTCNGESTLIVWSGDLVVFPRVPAPANWPKHWKLRADGLAPTSGGIISTSGLTGEGIRGSLKTLTTGEMVRPDFVLLDDPQTPESARSVIQNQVREQLVSADVLGMAGPSKTIAAVMPCTVIEPGDMVDRILDRKKHPLWRGQRTGILKSMPKNLAGWTDYFDVYARCSQLEPPDFTESNAYYIEHREELEEGAEASWEDRKLDGEVSAIQHAMHLYFRDPFAFWAEYMNQPKPLHAVAASVLDPALIAKKVTNVPRLTVPRSCTRITAFIDVGAHVLWYVVIAWDEKFGGQVLDYGPYPDQSRLYFAASDVRPALSDLPGMTALPQEAVIFSGLSAVALRVLGRKYVQEETGTEMSVEKCIVDANWGPCTDVVYEFCRRDPHSARLLPSHGKYIGPKATPINAWTKRDPNEQIGPGWRISTAEAGKRGRKVVFDTNKFKTFVAERFRTAQAAPGCLMLFAGTEQEHQMFSEHCAAEYPKPKPPNAGGYEVDEWVERIGRDNHFWDCVVGNAVAASVLGLRWDPGTAAGAAPAPADARPRVKWSDVQKAKKNKVPA